MNTQALSEALTDLIKEGQQKIGYTPNPVRFFFPRASMAAILESDDPPETIIRALNGHPAGGLGPLDARFDGERYAIGVSADGVTFVHENVPDSPFLAAFLAAIRDYPCTAEALMAICREHGEPVCRKVGDDEFDLLIFFPSGEPDCYRYCVKIEDGFGSYHRFTKADFDVLFPEGRETT